MIGSSPAVFSPADHRHMQAALSLGRRGLGWVWPNPAVGCVLVSAEGRVVGRGWTQPGGRPHAETEALRRAGAAARGATAYVTLEPCSHYGKTPPCAEALIASGVRRVVSALLDPDPRVGGRGLAMLRAAGLAVAEGLGEVEAAEINAGFLLRITQGRPLTTLKLATSLDGRIALANGESQWITGPDARALGHRLRAEHDAILVGSGTALADDPALTCRLPGLESKPMLRIVLDGGARLPLTARLLRDLDRHPLWILHRPDAPAARIEALAAAGARLFAIPADDAGRLDPAAALQALGGAGVTRVLIEGGGQVAGAFLRAGLVDRLARFTGPKLIGGEGRACLGSLGLERLADAPQFTLKDCTTLRNGVAELWARA